jgi:nitrogen fixation-related uncharacterized protein
MFYVWWIGLISVALWVSIVVFIWAVQTGQFSDQTRARYLPLRDEFFLPQADNPSKLPMGFYTMLSVIGMCFIINISILLIVIF